LSTTQTYKRIREERIKKGLTLRKVSSLLDIDVAILSKMERGERNLNKDILMKLARIYRINPNELLISFLSDRIVNDLYKEGFAKEVLKVAEQKLKNIYLPQKETINSDLNNVIKEIDDLKKRLNKFRPLDKTHIKKLEEYYEINYTYDSNKIEGNTLTLQETALVVEKGVTIGGKSLREHLEAINHYEAINYIKEIVSNKEQLNEWILKNIHLLILRGIDEKNAGKYREIEVRISGSKHIPPEFFKLPEMMEKYFEYYELNNKKLHPVILAADMHQKLVDIHPFVDGNGRTARLVMNLILLQNGYSIANISGDLKNRIEYYKALEKSQMENDNTMFRMLIANEGRKSLMDYTKLMGKM
jgi:fido (protein-threonine AMPylation protein)/transcriptional regulator with XRE-family HTH domain